MWRITTAMVYEFKLLFIVVGFPIIANSFQKLRQKGYRISIVKLFSSAVTLIAASCFVLSLRILNANESGYISTKWIILHFVLQAVGELLIATVGYAMVKKFAHRKPQGMMGLLATTVKKLGNKAIGVITTHRLDKPTTQLSALVLFKIAKNIKKKLLTPL